MVPKNSNGVECGCSLLHSGELALRLAWIDRAGGRRLAFHLPLVLAGLADERHDDDGTAQHGRHFMRDAYASPARRTLAPN